MGFGVLPCRALAFGVSGSSVTDYGVPDTISKPEHVIPRMVLFRVSSRITDLLTLPSRPYPVEVFGASATLLFQPGVWS